METGRVPLTRARLVLAWERGWPLLWPAAGWAGLCLALFLTDALPGLPDWLHLTVLILLALVWLGLLIWGGRRFRWPNTSAARQRIEQASGLTHRPLAALEDRLSGGDIVSRALWQAHVDRIRRQLGALRTGWPRAGLMPHDRYGLRAPVLLLLLVTGIGAGSDAPNHLLRALTPFSSGPAQRPVLDAWINPPAYTGLAPIFLTDTTPQPVRVPVGSRFTAQLSGAQRLAELHLDDGRQPFQSLESGHARLDRTITTGRSLIISVGGAALARWAIQVIPDDAPTAAFTAPPTISQRKHIRFALRAEDDYGLQSVIVTLRRPDAATDGALAADPIRLPQPITIGRRVAEGGLYHDLTAHIWAGLPVQAQVTALDGAGQDGVSDWLDLTLPERSFRHPVARALIALRKQMILSPDEIDRHRAGLGEIATRPQLYHHDTGLFLTLIVARARLDSLPARAAAAEVEPLLWAMAVKLEEGELGQREAELRAAEQALREAIANNADAAEIQRRMDEMQAALDRYLQAMVEQALNRLAQPRSERFTSGNQRTISRDQLQQMLDQARDLARMGQQEQAQALLDQLRQILENLAMAPPEEGEEGDDVQADDGTRQALQNLQALADRQRQLMDQGGSRRPSPGQSGQQEQLRRDLGEIMRQLGENGSIPQALGQAERAMNRAGEALRDGQGLAAQSAQREALEQMRDGARELIRRLTEGQGQGSSGGMAGRNGNQQRGERDPLGRDAGTGRNSDASVDIPANNQLQRARDIFDELRRRAADPDRPAIEREYLDRLLRPF